MRKFGFYLLGLILIAAAAAAIIVAAKSSKSHDDQASDTTTMTSSSAASSSKNACAIFTLADAKQLLGDNAKGGANGQNASSSDLAVSSCTYTQDSGDTTPVSAVKSATLLARAPKSQTGISSNNNEFGPLRPAGVQDVPGYVDKAYWDAEHGQLNILKNNVWYVLSYGPVTPADRTLEQATQMADLLINKL